jgi:hypothetical protein
MVFAVLRHQLNGMRPVLLPFSSRRRKMRVTLRLGELPLRRRPIRRSYG